jgi:hypothetical protein
VEYRQTDGWDKGLPFNAVLIHEYQIGQTPYSTLQQTFDPHNGGFVAKDHWIGQQGAVQFEVWVNSIDPSTGAASVSIGPVSLLPPF